MTEGLVPTLDKCIGSGQADWPPDPCVTLPGRVLCLQHGIKILAASVWASCRFQPSETDSGRQCWRSACYMQPQGQQG